MPNKNKQLSNEGFLPNPDSSFNYLSNTPNTVNLNIPKEITDQYRERYEAIIHTPLTPENINTYGSDALDKFVDLLGDAYAVYGIASGVNTNNLPIEQIPVEDEVAVAKVFFGLENSWDVLDNIISVQESINELSKRVANSKANSSSSYYVPPSPSEPLVTTSILPVIHGSHKLYARRNKRRPKSSIRKEKKPSISCQKNQRITCLFMILQKSQEYISVH